MRDRKDEIEKKRTYNTEKYNVDYLEKVKADMEKGKILSIVELTNILNDIKAETSVWTEKLKNLKEDYKKDRAWYVTEYDNREKRLNERIKKASNDRTILDRDILKNKEERKEFEQERIEVNAYQNKMSEENHKRKRHLAKEGLKLESEIEKYSKLQMQENEEIDRLSNKINEYGVLVKETTALKNDLKDKIADKEKAIDLLIEKREKYEESTKANKKIKANIESALKEARDKIKTADIDRMDFEEEKKKFEEEKRKIIAIGIAQKDEKERIATWDKEISLRDDNNKTEARRLKSLDKEIKKKLNEVT